MKNQFLYGMKTKEATPELDEKVIKLKKRGDDTK